MKNHIHLADNRILVTTAILVLFYISAILLFFFPIVSGGNQYDDSYITYRYAINLVDRGELTFNSYDRVNSATSLLYTLALSGFYALGLQDLEKVATWIGITSGIVAIVLTMSLALKVSSRVWLAGVCLFPMAISGSLTAWSVSGMETILYMSLLMLFFYLYATNRLAYALLTMALCMVTRPEAVILLVAVVMAELSRTDAKQNFGRIASFILAGGLTFALWLIWNLIYYGAALPNPVLFKEVALYYSPGLTKSATSIVKYLVGSFGLITLPGIVMGCLIAINSISHWLVKRKVFSRIPSSNLLVALSFFALGSIASFLLGPSADFNRYMVHLLPVLAVLTLSCFEHIFKAAPTASPKAGRYVLTPALYLGMAILVIGGARSFSELRNLSDFFISSAEHQEARKQLGGYIEQHVPNSQIIISSDIGAIAYMAKNHDFVDAVGLTSREPIEAIRHKQWGDFIQVLRTLKPSWVADTGTVEGRISAFEIIAEPNRFFRGVEVDPKANIDMYSPNNQVVLKISTKGPYVYRLVKIDVDVYN